MRCVVIFLLCLGCGSVCGQDFSYWATGYVPGAYQTPRQACDFLYSPYWWGADPNLTYVPFYDPQNNEYFNNGTVYECKLSSPLYHPFWGSATLETISCPEGASYDYDKADCGFSRQKGNPDEPLLCSNPSSKVGNPINVATGNKYEEEQDFKVGVVDPIIFSRYYNGVDGRWRHSYSTHLNFIANSVYLVRSDGREVQFDYLNNLWSSSNDLGALTQLSGGWAYQAVDGINYSFDSEGRLTNISTTDGHSQTLVYDGSTIIVSNDTGSETQITEDIFHQPTSVKWAGGEIEYAYSAYTGGRLQGVTKHLGGAVLTRQYYYEDERNPRWLTSIVDERGVRFATWTYDLYGRATSSQHANGASKTTLTYNNDGSTTVVNELGKQVTYRFQMIEGVKRIISVEGEPSSNCSASNSSYTYNDRGQVLTKTDAEGLITTYSYNDRGLEVSRIEATGTPLARTTTTEWDPSRFLKTKVVEPTRTTRYTYDAQGRQLSQQTTPN